MKDKAEILTAIREGLKDGAITEADLRTFITPPMSGSLAEVPAPDNDPANPRKLTAVDVMFLVAGIVLYSAILSFIVQSWNDGNALLHILMSAGVGTGLWILAFYLVKGPVQNDIRKGLINSLLLTGSLTIITGGYIITNELIGGFDQINYIPGAIMLAVVGVVHLMFDRLVRRDLTLAMGVLLTVAAFPALLFGILQSADLPIDVWVLVLIASAGLLVYAARTVSKIYPERQHIRDSFNSFAAFTALGSMYSASFGDYALAWLIALAAGVLGIFYLSVIFQSKNLLGNASTFLIITVITISFKYFSGFGITTSLILATIGLLGSAAIATGINKKYFNQPVRVSDPLTTSS